jgi:hypothetical protein
VRSSLSAVTSTGRLEGILFETTGMNSEGNVSHGKHTRHETSLKTRAERCAKFTDHIQDLATTYDQIPAVPGFL